MSENFKDKLIRLPGKPGVYRMLDARGKILYVGKAKDLKKRVASYFRKRIDSAKTAALMEKVADFEVTVTESENQALLLESNLIKKHRPHYNVLLRDDKSYPYLFLSTDHPFPRLDFHRGNKGEKGRYFGPYPNAGSVRDNLALIQKLFKLRQCRDSFFKHRTRPCLQYQINRCTAPCVGKVDEKMYHQQVEDTLNFLSGKNDDVILSVQKRMEAASDSMDYEQAAQLRDLLMRLRALPRQQFITGGKGNIDIFGVAEKMGQVAIAVVSIRGGQMIGHKTFFPNLPADTSIEEALSAFIPQYYLNPARESQSVDRIVLSHKVSDRLWIQSALTEVMKKSFQIMDRQTAAFREWEAIALMNAKQEVAQYIADKNNMLLKFEALQSALNLPNLPTRIECFDISHTSGEATKASCVVFGIEGPIRKAYRQFNIEGITRGDDYAAMKQALTRRYTQLKENNKHLPDLLIVDGGKGQLKQAAIVLESLQVSGVILMGVAKGPTRKPGLERLYVWGRKHEIDLSPDDSALHLIQFIRDEAHRFAITAHRKKRGKNRFRSKLDTVPGVGEKRRSALLNYFGGMQGLKKSSTQEIAKVPGISEALAKRIYTSLHED